MRQGLLSLYSPSALATWWVKIPAALRKYSSLLSAAWVDGVYLTAWPRAAMFLSVASLILGFTVGATHWSFWTIDATGGSQAVAFSQMLPLLLVAVAVGSLSGNAGTMLVLGYVIGDYLGRRPAVSITRRCFALAIFRAPRAAADFVCFLLHARRCVYCRVLAQGLRVVGVATSALYFSRSPLARPRLWAWVSGRSQ